MRRRIEGARLRKNHEHMRAFQEIKEYELQARWLPGWGRAGNLGKMRSDRFASEFAIVTYRDREPIWMEEASWPCSKCRPMWFALQPKKCASSSECSTPPTSSWSRMKDIHMYSYIWECQNCNFNKTSLPVHISAQNGLFLFKNINNHESPILQTKHVSR